MSWQEVTVIGISVFGGLGFIALVLWAIMLWMVSDDL